MKIVSNTSPILNLAAIGEVGLLEKLFGYVLVPKAVQQEIDRLRSSNSRFSKVDLPSFATVLAVENVLFAQSLKMQLHAGEAEAIALAIEQKLIAYCWMNIGRESSRNVSDFTRPGVLGS